MTKEQKERKKRKAKMWVDYAALTIWHEKGDGIRGGVRVTVTQQRPQDWSAMHTGVAAKA